MNWLRFSQILTHLHYRSSRMGRQQKYLLRQELISCARLKLNYPFCAILSVPLSSQLPEMMIRHGANGAMKHVASATSNASSSPCKKTMEMHAIHLLCSVSSACFLQALTRLWYRVCISINACLVITCYRPSLA